MLERAAANQRDDNRKPLKERRKPSVAEEIAHCAALATAVLGAGILILLMVFA